MRTVRCCVFVLLMLGMLLLCQSCSEVAITGRQQLNLVPDGIVAQMAGQQYQEFLTQNKLSNNASDTAMLQRVGLRLSDAVVRYCKREGIYDRIQDYQWQFSLIDSKEKNAFAMPGGKVVVYTGLLPVTGDETGLAVVMGHEIAHVIARHGNERMSQGLLVEFGGMALSKAMQSRPAATQDLFMRSYGYGAQLGFLLPYSRIHESEADRMGLIFMAMAGYDPRSAPDFWERMSQSHEGQGQPPEILSTHPADATRIANIKQHLPEAMYYYTPGG